jgi:phosphoribosylamine--glycine ligase
MGMKVLVIDSGGRGHALAWKLVQSPRVAKMFVAPGNGGTKKLGENVPIKVTEVEKLVQFAEKEKIDFVVASQDDSLAAGVVDSFQARGFKVFGPTRRAAEIESSKAFAKKAMTAARVPTASYRIIPYYRDALGYVRNCTLPVVVKASGLALGKGVRICKTVQEAETAVDDIMTKRIFGEAGNAVVVEDFLEGPEVSIHAFCDGNGFALFPSAQDHKPAFDGDQGPNTGGMGTISPVPWVSDQTMCDIGETIVMPILKELSKMERPFVGCLYPGLKITPEGPMVLEFNARPGDPEIQSYMRRLKTDLLGIMEACVDGKLEGYEIEWDNNNSAVTIVLASGGYPGDYKKGIPISGIEDAEKIPGVVVFHAGTVVADDGILKTSGGRVLGVTAICRTLEDALQTAYAASELIKFEGKQYRSDIGATSLALARF